MNQWIHFVHGLYHICIKIQVEKLGTRLNMLKFNFISLKERDLSELDKSI